MIAVQDIRAGTAFLLDGQPYIGLSYEHIKMGRGSATIKVKARNLLTGATVEKGFINSARVEEINTTRKPVQYLYQDGEDYVFMDPADYSQLTIPGQVMKEEAKFLKEGLQLTVQLWEERPLWVELPSKMEFTITETDPGIKGNSVSNMYKNATLDNGMVVRVPLFVEQGEKVIIDTRTGDYAERVKTGNF